jgi:hypothetical protein
LTFVLGAGSASLSTKSAVTVAPALTLIFCGSAEKPRRATVTS